MLVLFRNHMNLFCFLLGCRVWVFFLNSILRICFYFSLLGARCCLFGSGFLCLLHLFGAWMVCVGGFGARQGGATSVALSVIALG